MANASLSPSHPLTLENPPPPPGVTRNDQNRFIFFSKDWLDMQTFVARALKLPISVNTFKDAYGEFSDEAEVTGAVSSMKAVQGLSAQFGNPTIIKQKIAQGGSYLTGDTPPAEIYGHIVWLATQIQNTADTFSFTFKSLNDIIGPKSGTPAERAANLKMILDGDGGLSSTAADMKTKTSALSQKLAAFDTALTAADAGLSKYTADQSTILNDAKSLISKYELDINGDGTPENPGLLEKAHEAYKEWRDYTIAATTTSIGLMIISGGILAPVAAALGVGLGVKAAEEKNAYNALMGDIAEDEAKIIKKTQLVVDLGGLNKILPDINTALKNFQDDLSKIEGVWTDIGASLQYIVSNYSDEQLADLNFINQALDIMNAQNKWGDISDTSKQFTVNSLVDLVAAPAFGQPLPAAA